MTDLAPEQGSSATGVPTEAPQRPGPRGRFQKGHKMTRGRSADPSAVSADTGERLTRRSRLDGDQNPYAIPPDVREPGWDYEWKTQQVMGAPVSSSDTIRVHESGWRPVLASSRVGKAMTPPGWNKKTVERDGLILMCRPERLTVEAKNEDLHIAQEQKQSKLEAALAGEGQERTALPRFKETFEIEGVVGTAKPVDNR